MSLDCDFKTRMIHMKEKESVFTFLKNLFFGLFVESWILLWYSVRWHIGTIKRIFVGTDCPLSPRSCLGAVSSDKEQSNKEEGTEK